MFQVCSALMYIDGDPDPRIAAYWTIMSSTTTHRAAFLPLAPAQVADGAEGTKIVSTANRSHPDSCVGVTMKVASSLSIMSNGIGGSHMGSLSAARTRGRVPLVGSRATRCGRRAGKSADRGGSGGRGHVSEQGCHHPVKGVC